MESPRALSTMLAAGRVGAGSALVLAPAAVGRRWMGAAAETPGGTVAVRALGIRDLALGALTVASLSGRLGSPATAATLVAAGAACDLVDGAASLGARRALPPAGTAVGVFALAAAAAGAALVQQLRATA